MAKPIDPSNKANGGNFYGERWKNMPMENYPGKNKKKINWKHFFGNILFGGMILPVVAGVAYFSYREIKTQDLKKQVYEIADTNHNSNIEYEELSQLASDLELIAKDEVLSQKDLEKRLDIDGCFSNAFEKYESYINSHK
jgi:hypothetical protein